MENLRKSGEYNNRFLNVTDEIESLRTIDEIHDLNDVEESESRSVNNIDISVERNDRLGPQGLNQTSFQTSMNNLGDLNEIIRRQIEIREAEKIREITNLSTRVPERPTISSRASSSETLKGSDITTLKLIVDLIPIFDGNNISVQAFARECRFAEEGVSRNLLPLLIRLLKAKIKGEAELYVRNLQFETLDELLNTLERAFGAPKTLFQTQSEIAQMKQNVGEPILTYAARAMELFSKLAEIAKSQSPANIAAIKIREYDVEVTSCFCLGLRGELEFRVRQKNPTTLQQAINFAIESEREAYRRKRLYGEIEDSLPSTSRQHLEKFSIREPAQKKYKSAYHIDNRYAPVQNPKSKLTCYTCGKENHTSRNCQERKFRPSNHGYKIKRDRLDSKEEGRPKCDYCSNFGHTRLSCLLRRAEEAEKELERLRQRQSSSISNGSRSLNSLHAHRQSTTMSSQTKRQSNAQCSQSQKKN